MKVWFEGDCNVTYLAKKFQKTFDIDVEDGGFDGISANLLNKNSQLNQSEEKDYLIVCLFRSFQQFEKPIGSAEWKVELSDKLASYASAIEGFAQTNPHTEVVVFLPVLNPLTAKLMHMAAAPQDSPKRFCDDVVAKMGMNLSSSRNINLIETELFVLQKGFNTLFDDRLNRLTSSPFSDQGLQFFSNLTSDIISALSTPRKKLIICDLDNTLWNGIVGEDGPHGIRCDSSTIGRPHYDLQLYLKSLMGSGFVLAISSKNNMQDVEEAFSTNKHFPLKLDDFSVHSVGWHKKDQGIRDILEDLSLGEDSAIFIDDNEMECEWVKSQLGGVDVINFDPNDLTTFSRLLENKDVWKLRINTEDITRVESYKSNKEIKALEENADTFEEFIKGLNIELSIESLNDRNFERAFELIHKTNQFNLSLERTKRSDLAKALDRDKLFVFCVSVKDKFSDYGVMGVVLVAHDPNAFCISNFVMSCRILGRDIEKFILQSVVSKLTHLDPEKLITSVFREGPKNAIVKGFYDCNSFVVVKQKNTNGVVKEYCYDKAKSQTSPIPVKISFIGE